MKRSVRQHPEDPTLALLELTQGHFAVISIVDAEAAGQFNWCARNLRGAIYAYRTTREARGLSGQQGLHQFIGERMGIDTSQLVDHRNGNGIDCRRMNLRSATKAQNNMNKRRSRNNTSGVKGVTWFAPDRKWQARVGVNGRRVLVGYFSDLEQARVAVTKARARLHGEFANHGEVH